MSGSRLSALRLLIDCFSHRCCNHLQVLGIDLVEGGGVAGIEIQDGNQSALAVENRHYYLGLASWIARYVSLEGVHIRNNLRRPSASRSAAYSLRESDFQTAHRALIRADSEQVRLPKLYSIIHPTSANTEIIIAKFLRDGNSGEVEH